MKKQARKLVPLVMVISILFSSFSIMSFAAPSDVDTAKAIADDVQNWLFDNVGADENDTDIDGNIDWSVFANARFSLTNYGSYLSYINAAVEENYDTLYLSDLARISLAVGANGGNARAVGGHDLIADIAATDFDKQTFTTSISFALLALNSKAYGEDAAAEALLQILLAAQRADGGYNYKIKLDPADTYSTDGDIDTTAMVLQALAPYADEPAAAAVITGALAFIKAGQKDSGGFGGMWGESADSTAQALAALSTLGIDPFGDDYIKGGKSILDAIKAYQNDDGGINGWDGNSNIMSSYQMLYALTAYIRFAEESGNLYVFSDVEPFEEEETTTDIDTTDGETETVEDTAIPDTGMNTALGAVVLLLACVALTAVLKNKKNDE